MLAEKLRAAALGVVAPTGVTWTYRAGLSSLASWGSNTAFAVGWNGTVFCALGLFGRCATSPNGATWTYQSGLASTGFGSNTGTAITWNGSIFCILGVGGKCATSSDGVTWTNQTGLASTAWGSSDTGNSIIWTGSVFCAVGTGGRLATSPNGSTWTYRSGLSALPQWGLSSVEGVAWNGSVFCVVGPNNLCATSPDAVTWTIRTLSNLDPDFYLADSKSIVWNGSIFCVTVQLQDFNDFTYYPGCFTSPDGITWTYRSSLASVSLVYESPLDLIWNGTVFCVVGSGGFGGVDPKAFCATSPNGITWTRRPALGATAFGNNDAESIAASPSAFCVVGASGACATSP